VEHGRVAVHEPHDALAGLRGAGDQLGAARVGERLTVLAEPGIKHLDPWPQPAGEVGLTHELVEHKDVGAGDDLDGAKGEQAGVAGAGAHKGDALDRAGRRAAGSCSTGRRSASGAAGGGGSHEARSGRWCWSGGS
jgi:hypothetical protein